MDLQQQVQHDVLCDALAFSIERALPAYEDLTEFADLIAESAKQGTKRVAVHNFLSPRCKSRFDRCFYLVSCHDSSVS